MSNVKGGENDGFLSQVDRRIPESFMVEYVFTAGGACVGPEPNDGMGSSVLGGVEVGTAERAQCSLKTAGFLVIHLFWCILP